MRTRRLKWGGHVAVLGITMASPWAAGGCAEGVDPNEGDTLPPSVASVSAGSASATDGASASAGTESTTGLPDSGTTGSTGRDEPDPTLPDLPPDCPVGSEGCDCTPGGACDDGLSCEADTCEPAPAVCGNDMLEGDEECDDGASNADNAQCKSDCTMQFCGDGFTGPGEACDDGNQDDTDGCTSTCAPASCGDGIAQVGEDCDDANAEQTDACLNTCVAASCGDSIVHAGAEECDDGNASDADGCLASCLTASCGDGFVYQGQETCDDGNGTNDDGCTNACACGTHDFAQNTDISGWSLTGGWGLYTASPTSSHPAVAFPSQVVGTDGNRVPPYPGSQVETSSLTTGTFVIPETLTFQSWHVDEGGASVNGYDNKRILVSVDGGGTWSTLVNCSTGPLASLPFCAPHSSARAGDDWDLVEIDTGVFGGDNGQIRLEYASGDSCCSFEQGWFIDDANFRTCG